MLLMRKLKHGKNARKVAETVIHLLMPYKGVVRTITTDNGTEFACHRRITRSVGAKVYFADPYSSWQKGAVENANGLVRQYIPKSTTFTNASDMKTVMDNVVSNPRFLYSAFGKFSNDDIVNLIEAAGCPTKVERGNRVFPVSDHSSDVIKALEKTLRTESVKVYLNEEVKGLLIKDGVCRGIKLGGSRSDFLMTNQVTFFPKVSASSLHFRLPWH